MAPHGPQCPTSPRVLHPAVLWPGRRRTLVGTLPAGVAKPRGRKVRHYEDCCTLLYHPYAPCSQRDMTVSRGATGSRTYPCAGLTGPDRAPPESRDAGGRAGQERPAPHFTTILQHFYRAFMTRYHAPSILLGVGPSQWPRLRAAAGLPWSEQGARSAGRASIAGRIQCRSVREPRLPTSQPRPLGAYGCRRIRRSATAAGTRLPPRILGRPPSWARRRSRAALNLSSVPPAPRCEPRTPNGRTFGDSTTAEYAQHAGAHGAAPERQRGLCQGETPRKRLAIPMDRGKAEEAANKKKPDATGWRGK
jgi:hypothetical protein